MLIPHPGGWRQPLAVTAVVIRHLHVTAAVQLPKLKLMAVMTGRICLHSRVAFVIGVCMLRPEYSLFVFPARSPWQ